MIVNTVRPVLPWQPLDEIINGVLVRGADQFEAGDVAKQLTLDEVGGRPALRILVDSGSQYGNSTWLRGIGRLTSPTDERFIEGSRVTVAKQVTIPAGQILAGATVIDEAHGPGQQVAPVRLIVRSDGNLYASFNGGTFVNGGFSGWTREQLVGPFTFGIEHKLAYEILFHRDPTKGRLTVWLDGDRVFDRAGATGQVVNGAWQHPYLLSGIYVGSASVPIVCFIHGIAVSDADYGEAALALRRILTANEPPPVVLPPAPVYVTRAELDALLTEQAQAYSVGITTAVAAERARAEAAEQTLTGRVAKTEGRLAVVYSAALASKTAAFSKQLLTRWPL